MYHEFKSDFAKRYTGALGKARGMVREQVLGCADLDQLESWLNRAGTAATIEDVIGASDNARGSAGEEE